MLRIGQSRLSEMQRSRQPLSRPVMLLAVSCLSVRHPEISDDLGVYQLKLAPLGFQLRGRSAIGWVASMKPRSKIALYSFVCSSSPYLAHTRQHRRPGKKIVSKAIAPYQCSRAIAWASCHVYGLCCDRIGGIPPRDF